MKNKYFIFASDERSFLDLKNIVIELKKRNLDYFFLYSNSPQRISPTNNLEKFNYDTNTDFIEKHHYNTLGIELPFVPDYVIISNENWDPEKSILYEFKTQGAFIASVETSSYTIPDLKTKLEIKSRKSFPTNCIDMFFDHSKWSKETKEICGWYSSKSQITGNPKYDDLGVSDIKEENIIIIHGVKDRNFHNLLIEKIHKTIIPKFKDYEIYYKPHPYEINNFPHNFDNNKIKNSPIKLINSHQDYLELMKKSKYIISYFTSLLFFPLFFDKKIIILPEEKENIDISGFSSFFNEEDFNFWKNIFKINTFKGFQDFFDINYVNKINKRNKQIIDDLNKYLIPFDTLDLTKETRNDIVLRYFSDFKDQKSSSRIIEYLENNLVN